MPPCCKAVYFLICCCASAPVDDDGLISSQDRQEQVEERVAVEKKQQNVWPFTAYVESHKTPSNVSDQPLSVAQRRELNLRVLTWMQHVQAASKFQNDKPSKLEHEL